MFRNFQKIICGGLAVVMVVLSCAGLAHAEEGRAEPAWANPAVQAIKRVSPLSSAQIQPVFLSNLDCTLLTYRFVNTSQMRTGCFTPTAYGLFDSDSTAVIFGSTDEAVPLRTYISQQVLAPWPNALNLLALGLRSTGGAAISMYKNPLASMQDQRNALGQVIAKQIMAAPELPLTDASGVPLVVNPQTIAFSSSGSWLVAETLTGAFVRINLATLEVKAFAPSYYAQGSPGLLASQVTITDSGRYVAIGNSTAHAVKVYDLSHCAPTPESVYGCQVHDYWPSLREAIVGLQNIRHLRYVNDSLLTLEAITKDEASDGTYLLAPTGTITSYTDYIGLGDSYTSGEGGFDYVAGTDTDKNHCHTSRNSYPLLLSNDVYSLTSGHNIACSGAKIYDIVGDNRYRGQVRGGDTLNTLAASQSILLDAIRLNYSPGYVAQQWFIKQWQPKVITVSIGSNDIGFSELLKTCVMPHISLHSNANTCYNTYESRAEIKQLVDRTIPRWINLYKQLQSQAPGMQVYAIGYPDIISDTGSCALNVHLSQGEAAFAKELVRYINQAVERAASQADVNYVDITEALVGHRLCETSSHNVAVNGLTAGDDLGALGIEILGRESYHPNILGYRLIEQTILQKTHNLTVPSTPSGAAPSGDALTNQPKTGRSINTLVPLGDMTKEVVTTDTNSSLTIDGLQVGLLPSSSYTVHLDGPTGPVIGTLPTDITGVVNGNVTIPANTSPGGHSVDVTGPDQSGGTVDVNQPIYVPEHANDTDGDGIIDPKDSCPTVYDSGQDTDQDGVDDACDGAITQPPSQPHDSDPDPPSNGTSSAPGPTGSTSSTGSNDPTGKPTLETPAFVSTTNSLAPAGMPLSTATLQPNNTLSTNNASLRLGGRATTTPQSATASASPTVVTKWPILLILHWAWILLVIPVTWLLLFGWQVYHRYYLGNNT
jgi:lysophospholipase L1-like esterase